MKLLPLSGLLIVAACAAAPADSATGARPADRPEVRVSAAADARVTALGLSQGERGWELAGSLTLHRPLLPSHRQVRVVARDQQGSVVLDTLVTATPRPEAARHRSDRQAWFRVRLDTTAALGSVEVSCPHPAPF